MNSMNNGNAMIDINPMLKNQQILQIHQWIYE
jgi:hypothetical protein